MHDPESAELRREAGRKGGRNRSAKARAIKQLPETLTSDELSAWLSLLFKRVMAGQTEPRVGTAAATIAKTLLEVRTMTELERRLEELEARAALNTQWRAS